MDNPLLLKNLPVYSCCMHCKIAYCPEAKGHYAVCPIKVCEQGRELINKES